VKEDGEAHIGALSAQTSRVGSDVAGACRLLKSGEGSRASSRPMRLFVTYTPLLHSKYALLRRNLDLLRILP